MRPLRPRAGGDRRQPGPARPPRAPRPRARSPAGSEQMRGRGACQHPDGAARFVASALDVLRRRGRPPPARPLQRRQPRDPARSGSARREPSAARQPDRLRGARPLRRAPPRADHARRLGLPDRRPDADHAGASRRTRSARSPPARCWRCCSKRPGRPPRARRAGRSSSPARSIAASAIARSWIASPVESKSVISSSRLAARRRCRSRTAPSVVTSSRASAPASTAAASSPPCARLLPVVAEDACARELGDGDLRLPGPVGAHQRDVLAGSERALREAAPRCPGVTVTTRSAASASSRDPATRAPSSSAAAAARVGVDVPEHHVLPARDERPRGGPAVHACADHRGRARAGRASRLRAPPPRPSAAPSPRRRRASRRGCPSEASESSTTPVTVGSPRAGFPGYDVTHFSDAWPAPSAGIARKSPAGYAGT